MGRLVDKLARSLPADPRGGKRKTKPTGFGSEAELAAVIVAHLREQGWTVYQEVECGQGSERADIVATKDADVLEVECKLSLSLDLLAQANHWRDYAPLVAIAVPMERRFTRARQFGESVARERGFGLFEVAAPMAGYQPARITVEREPKRGDKVVEGLAKRLAAVLCPEQEDYAAAGNAEGKRWTPWRGSITRARAIVLEQPGIGSKELVEKLGKHHWASNAGARAGLVDAAKRGLFDGVVAQRGAGQRWQFFPEGQQPEPEQTAPSETVGPAAPVLEQLRLEVARAG